MKRAYAWTVLVACCGLSGCAAGGIVSREATSALALVDREATSDPQSEQPSGEDPWVVSASFRANLFQEAVEDVPKPGPAPMAQFKAPFQEKDIDRLARRVVDTVVDIRPPEGEMPTDLAEARWATIGPDRGDGSNRDLVECSWTPWEICHRPLYFEDVKLERYGISRGFLQPAFSGVRFFGGAMLMPCKIIIQPPRSCECSNGFSRLDDTPWLVRYARGQQFVMLGPDEEDEAERMEFPSAEESNPAPAPSNPFENESSPIESLPEPPS